MTTKEITPLYAEGVNMLDGLADDKVNCYLEENPRIVSLFRIDIVEIVTLDVPRRMR